MMDLMVENKSWLNYYLNVYQMIPPGRYQNKFHYNLYLHYLHHKHRIHQRQVFHHMFPSNHVYLKNKNRLDLNCYLPNWNQLKSRKIYKLLQILDHLNHHHNNKQILLPNHHIRPRSLQHFLSNLNLHQV